MKKDVGFRYYQSAPYLLIYTDNQGGVKSQILFLPDTAQKMSIRPYNILASSNVQLNFDNGVLTGTDSSADETIIPKAVISAIEKVASAAAAKAFMLPGTPQPTATNTLPSPYLYKIVLAADGELKFVGSQGEPELVYFGNK
jgi:hypothetical protein